MEIGHNLDGTIINELPVEILNFICNKLIKIKKKIYKRIYKDRRLLQKQCKKIFGQKNIKPFIINKNRISGFPRFLCTAAQIFVGLVMVGGLYLAVS
jgi:hypothetical protein